MFTSATTVIPSIGEAAFETFPDARAHFAFGAGIVVFESECYGLEVVQDAEREVGNEVLAVDDGGYEAAGGEAEGG